MAVTPKQTSFFGDSYLRIEAIAFGFARLNQEWGLWWQSKNCCVIQCNRSSQSRYALIDPVFTGFKRFADITACEISMIVRRKSFGAILIEGFFKYMCDRGTSPLVAPNPADKHNWDVLVRQECDGKRLINSRHKIACDILIILNKGLGERWRERSEIWPWHLRRSNTCVKPQQARGGYS